MPLSDTAIKKAKPGPKPVKLSDAKGLYLLVNPTGSKLWRWKYRVLGKEKVMTLGGYPEVSLAQARDGMEAARKLLAAGSDPMANRKADKLASRVAAENSFETVARIWWAHWKPARSEQHAAQVMRRFEAKRISIHSARVRCRMCKPRNWWPAFWGDRGARRQRPCQTCAPDIKPGFDTPWRMGWRNAT